MENDDDIMEFGFEDSDHIKTQGLDKWKQNRAGEKSRICIISFSRFHDAVLRKKTKDKGEPLTDEEKADIIGKVDVKIAAQLKKSVDDLTEADRLDIRAPKFFNSYTHYDKKEEDGGYGAGTFRCLSTWRQGKIVKHKVCCKKFSEPDQKIACAIMTYPVTKDGSVDLDLLKEQKYTEFFGWAMSPKKFKQVESCYADARSEDKYTVDLKVELDGDPQYQKQKITTSTVCAWSQSEFDPEIREWILNQGLRVAGQVNSILGYKLSEEKLIEKLNAGKSVRSFEGSAAAASTPTLPDGGYGDLLE